MDVWNLKVGDMVVETLGFSGERIGKVERITKTQVVLDTGGKYRRTNGRQVGADKWSNSHIVPASEADIIRVRMRNMRDAIDRITPDRLDEIPDEKIVSAYALLFT